MWGAAGTEHHGEPAALEMGEASQGLPGSLAASCWEYPVGLCLGWEVEHGLSTPCLFSLGQR